MSHNIGLLWWSYSCQYLNTETSAWSNSVMNLFLRIGNKNNSYIRETQENSIEFIVQSSLPYILLLMVCAHYCAPYPKWPCVWHEANMCCPCCMMSLYSRTFYSILLSPMISLWLCHWFVTDVTAWLINPNPSCSKNRKWKIKKKKKKNKVREKIKWSPLSMILTNRGVTIETLSISYTFCLYIRTVVTL